MMWIFVAIVLQIICIVGLVGLVLCHKGKYNRAKESLGRYERRYRHHQGWTAFRDYGSYDLRSFDGGKNWYAVETKFEWLTKDRSQKRVTEKDYVVKVKILGPAEEVFPGLLAHTEGLDALQEYVKENGPITLSSERLQTDKAVLEAAGFEVKVSKEKK